MKRGNLLRLITGIAMTLFVANGLFAQVEVADYAAITGAATEIDSVTVGSTTRLYVKPDAYFHPNYTALGSWALTADFTWVWSVPAAAGAADAAEATSTDDVWVQVDWSGTAGGPYNVTVTETAPAAFGGCSGDTNVWVSVIASPTVTYTAGAGFISRDTTLCEGDGFLANNLQATLAGIRSFQLDWNLEIATLDAGGGKELYWNLTKTLPGNPVQLYAVENDRTTGNQQDGINATTLNLTLPTGGFTSIDDGTRKKSTLYTYSLNAVNDRISRKSDYLTNAPALATGWTWYDTTAETITIRVNPAPVTGPIYHIPNDWQP